VATGLVPEAVLARTSVLAKARVRESTSPLKAYKRQERTPAGVGNPAKRLLAEATLCAEVKRTLVAACAEEHSNAHEGCRADLVTTRREPGTGRERHGGSVVGSTPWRGGKSERGAAVFLTEAVARRVAEHRLADERHAGARLSQKGATFSPETLRDTETS
jgi:hypothetical protein